MLRRRHSILLPLLAAVIAVSSLATTTAAPGLMPSGSLLQASKAEAEAKKQDAQARKDAARVEKERAKCAARENWPCYPVVTLEWVPDIFSSGDCHIRVTVAGFAPGTYNDFLIDSSPTNEPFIVGRKGTGNLTTAASFGLPAGQTVTASVNGIESAPVPFGC